MDIERIVSELRGEIDRISHAIGLLEGNNTPAKARVGRPPASSGSNGRGGRTGGITPAGRRKLAQAMKRRWAQRKVASSASAPTANVAAKPKKRGGITAAGRKKLSEAMKRRWAEKKRKAS
jgi:hypothetical protein